MINDTCMKKNQNIYFIVVFLLRLFEVRILKSVGEHLSIVVTAGLLGWLSCSATSQSLWNEGSGNGRNC